VPWLVGMVGGTPLMATWLRLELVLTP